MKDYKGLDIHGTKNQFDDWWDSERGDSDELDVAFEDEEDEY